METITDIIFIMACIAIIAFVLPLILKIIILGIIVLPTAVMFALIVVASIVLSILVGVYAAICKLIEWIKHR